MKLCFYLVLSFLTFCNMQAKDIFIDLDADLPNLTSISVESLGKDDHIFGADLSTDTMIDHAFEVHFYTNVKNPVELVVFSKASIDGAFTFIDKNKNKTFPLYLFSSKEEDLIGNNDVIFSASEIKEPTSKVIPLGIIVPKIKNRSGISGILMMQLTVKLKYIG